MLGGSRALCWWEGEAKGIKVELCSFEIDGKVRGFGELILRSDPVQLSFEHADKRLL